MLTVRPIGPKDQDALYQIAVDSDVGFTSLPINRDMLEDTLTGEVIGTTAVEASLGKQAPLYHYHRQTVVHASPTLEVHNKMEVPTLCNHYTGSAEVCTLFYKKPIVVALTDDFYLRVDFCL